MQVDFLIKNAYVFNSYFKNFEKTSIAVLKGKILFVGEDCSMITADKEIDYNGRYIIPGLIDIHMHIESTMATPKAFAHELSKNGVTTIVSEPHEIANVFGLRGIEALLEESESSLVDIFFGVPSSVPATSLELETTGSEIGIEDLKYLLKKDSVVCLGEVMNYVDVVYNEDSKSRNFIREMQQSKPFMAIEGHCPRLSGLELSRFIYAGVDSDHTQQSPAGLLERIKNGMFVELQEKSLTEDVLEVVNKNNLQEHIALVTDDVTADKFSQQGHLNHLVKKAVQLGSSPEMAIYMASFTPARRIGWRDRGSIAPGKIADFVVLDNLTDFNILATYKKGQLIYDYYNQDKFIPQKNSFPKDFYSSVVLPKVTADQFVLSAPLDKTSVCCRIINVQYMGTFTNETLAELKVVEGKIDWQNSPFLLIAMLERYGKSNNITLGLISGECIKQGAIATTYAHDSHNLLVMGKTLEDIVLAVNRVIELNGAYVVVHEGKILAEVALPVAGILSELAIPELAQEVAHLKNSITSLGYNNKNVLMSFSTLGLAVSPALKITDVGLVDVANQKVVPLIID